MTTRNFFRVALVAVLAAVIGESAVGAEATEKRTPEKEAQAAAEKWLALVDAAKYVESWNTAAAYFRGAVTEKQWVAQMGGVRKPLGGLVSRKFKEAKPTKTAPGAPDGEYVILSFETSFENKKEAFETVTPMRDKDGEWRVAGYFIR